MELGTTLVIIAVIFFLASLKQINQYERGVLFTMGRYSGIMSPGWRFIWPIFQSFKRVDIRIKAVDVPDQKAITKDNVSVMVNAVIYYKVSEPEKAVIEVENFYYAISNYAQTTMRNIVGETTLDELLSQREKIANRIMQLGSIPKTDPNFIINNSHAKYVECDNIKDMIRENLIAERIAVYTYRELIQYIGNDDPTTRRMLEDILATEEEHVDDIQELSDEYQVTVQ